MEQVAEECATDVLFNLYRKGFRKISDADGVRPYTRKCARRAVITAWRRNTRYRQRVSILIVDPDHLSDGDRHGQSQGESEVLLRAVRALSEEGREVIQRRWFEDQSIAEIATDMQLPREAVYRLLGRAMRSLRRALGALPRNPR